MSQPHILAEALAATSIQDTTTLNPPKSQLMSQPAKVSFASALRSGQNTAHSIPSTLSASTVSTSTPATSTQPSSASHLAPVDDTILHAIRKRDDRIFFSQYENQMSAFVRDSARSHLELGAMNAYQRLLIHRCADQFSLDHQLDRATHCITLSKTHATTHPPVLLSIRAREHLLQRDGIDPVNAHPTASTAAPSLDSPTPSAPSASTSTASLPAPTPPSTSSPPTVTPKAAFKIMRRDPSNNRQSRLRSDHDLSGSNSDSERAAAKARKDMTLEEREASYKAARARIFGDVDTSDAGSPTSSTTTIDHTKQDHVRHAASVHEAEASPTNSAASSPVASIAAARSTSKNKAASSSSSAASQDGSTQRTRGTRKAGLSYVAESTNNDLDFSRALPSSANPIFGAAQQSSPLALPGHVTQGYFPPTHPYHLQQSHSNPNLRSRAPTFHPQGTSTPAYSQGGALRYPDGRAQPVQPDAFPALLNASSTPGQKGANIGRQAHAQHGSARNASASTSDVWNAQQPAGQEQPFNGVGAWAQQTSDYVQNTAMPRHPRQQQQQQQQHQQVSAYLPHQQVHHQFQQGVGPYNMGYASLTPQYTPLGSGQPFMHTNHAGPRSATSSRASSQRGSGAMHNSRGARDDAVSVSSISSTTSSRSASLSGVSAAGSTTQTANANSKGSGAGPTLPHPSLPARPTWLSSSNAE
ncbi:uncharacterized protein MEPE_03928 [Melanopsichium pennsylvanicum]|uniref:SUZ domain-containing protein n=2 Tax=Melanopsichium pennsylvanicum TaxID=63383 RepID=A0AAJ4XMS3_9BASI|nr:r3h domain-containing protein [Melanopsichium pennsylvanicum 4]SNX85219.1 uncharacterized protein MEPE_03928 [Melanopsichium pennsylvanicum]